MATYDFTTDDEDEAALTRWLVRYPEPGLTKLQLLRRLLRHFLTNALQELREERRTSVRDAYEAATPADKAAIDAILDKYR